MSLCLDILFQVVRIVELRLGQTPSCQVMCQDTEHWGWSQIHTDTHMKYGIEYEPVAAKTYSEITGHSVYLHYFK